MNDDTNRYIAEIEIPEGLATMDCEIELLDKNVNRAELRLILSNYTYEIPKRTQPQRNLTLREELDYNNEAVRITNNKDIKSVIEEYLRKAYGEDADIMISIIDMD